MSQKIIPTVHLIHGFIGAGKTTFSKKLEQEIGAIRFTQDEWMTSLFGKDPFPGDRDQFEKFNNLVVNLLQDVAFRCLANGNDIIFDDGFRGRKRRDDINQRIKKLGAKAQWYYVKASNKEMKERTLQRTKNPPKESFHIDEHAIEELRKYFEPLGKDEEHVVIDNVF